MELSKFIEYKDDNTEKVGTYVIQFSFAGIAVIWIFSNINSHPFLPEELIFPLILLALTLTFSLLQVLYAGIAWSIFHRYHEKRKDKGTDPLVSASKFINWPTWFFFILKVLSFFIAYILIIIFLASKI